MDRWATPAKQVASLTWIPPPPCKQALSYFLSWGQYNKTFTSEISTCEVIILSSENSSDTCVIFFYTFK